MMDRRNLLWGIATFGLFAGILIGAGDAPKKQDLGGEDRYLTVLSTDKPIYRAGESVRVRGVALRAGDRKPLVSGQMMVEIKGPKGDILALGTAQIQDGSGGFEWKVPAGAAGGEYILAATYPWQGYAPAERKFDIRAYRAPRLKSQIIFVRDGYGPGDTAGASMHVERAEGGIPAGAKVTAIARIDGAEAWKGQAQVDAEGNCSVSFKLPDAIERGEGTLAMIIEDGGAVETAAKTIPILLQTVDLSMYPEGGDLVAGLSNRVYLEARTPAKKPADIAGVVVDDKGMEVAAFRTEHEGRGRFNFTPKAGGKYALKINEPAGIKTTYPLPEAKPSGVVLSAPFDLVVREQPVALKVAVTDAGEVTLSLRKREVEVASAKVKLAPGQASEVNLTPPATADGVLIATAWDAAGKPLAERLIYRQPARQVKIEILPGGSQFVPGEKVSVQVRTTDGAGKPIGAVVGLTVTDDSVLEMIEKREQAPRLPAMFLLENDVREIADAHVYLDEANAKAPLAVDLLLGTQGWRRFAFIDPLKFASEHGDAARRVLALRVQRQVERENAGAIDGAFGGGDIRVMRAAGVPKGAAMANGVEGAAQVDDLMVANAPVAPPPGEPMPAAAAEAPAMQLPARDQKMDQALEEAEKKQAAGRLAVAARRPRQMRNDLVAIREYAHPVRPNRADGDRVDFTETLYWNAGLKTDDKTGEGTFSFDLSDAVTSFRIFADAFETGGGLGTSTATVDSVQPFYAEPKLPLELTSGDVVDLPVGLVNGMPRDLPLAKIQIQAAPGITISGAEDGFTLKGKERIRRLVKINAGAYSGETDFNLTASAGPFSDRVLRKLRVQPIGFPIENAHGGMLAANAPVGAEFTMPDTVVKDSVIAAINVYPTPLANLTEALERLIQEPGGCFEQTSATSYPLVMAQQYFLSHTGVDPKLIDRSRMHLDNAYQRLAGFECKQKGYEWFGADPGHEALTAYGLMQFVDMGQVREVDAAMVQRTRQWLLDRRDGKGGFQRNSRALDSFGGAPEETTNAYVTWALLESGQKNLEKEIEAVRKSAMATQDSYILALGANVLMLAGDKEGARQLMTKLAAKQKDSGEVDGAVTSITRSGGEALAIETTALSMLAWMRDPAFTPRVEKSMKWLAEMCKSGRFGSTQSTILALRAIINYDKSRARPKAPGSVQLLVDNKSVGQAVAFTADTKGPIELPDVGELLTPGKHTIALKMEGGSEMPCSITVRYYSAQPASSPQCKLRLEVALRDAQVREGAVTEAAVKVTNTADEVVHMPVAIVGIPAGLEVRHDQLKELVRSNTIAAYEVIGRDVVIYWRGLPAKAQVSLPISLIAAIPGTYTAPASRAYLYYTDEHKHWIPAMKATVVPANN